MNAATLSGLAIGATIGGLTVASFVANRDLPPTPGDVTGRELLAQSRYPLAFASVLTVGASAKIAMGLSHTFGSKGAGPMPAALIAGVAAGAAGAGIIAGGAAWLGHARAT